MTKLPTLTMALASALAIGAASCSTAKNETQLPAPTPAEAPVTIMGDKSASFIPDAVLYKTNGNYDQNVPVTLNEAGNQIMSYPAPGDVSEKSTPVAIANGWLLDRRGGIGKNTAFLKYTYKEYSQLKQAPSRKELMEAIIPDAKVTEVKVLPVNINQAYANPEALKQYAE